MSTACGQGSRLLMSTAIGQMTYRHRRYLYGPTLVDATGSQRRLQALARLGWSVPALERRAGLARWALDGVLTTPGVHRSRAELISWLYGELWDREAPLLTPSHRYSAGEGEVSGRERRLGLPRWGGTMMTLTFRHGPYLGNSRDSLSPCGTPAAARRHYRRGEPTCQPCRTAERRRWAKRSPNESFVGTQRMETP